mgnify:CR=1 FL=1
MLLIWSGFVALILVLLALSIHLARRLAAIQTVQGVVAAYWDLVLAERQVAITRASLDLARDHLAGREMHVGRWYQRQGLMTAAIGRFRLELRPCEEH